MLSNKDTDTSSIINGVLMIKLDLVLHVAVKTGMFSSESIMTTLIHIFHIKIMNFFITLAFLNTFRFERIFKIDFLIVRKKNNTMGT